MEEQKLIDLINKFIVTNQIRPSKRVRKLVKKTDAFSLDLNIKELARSPLIELKNCKNSLEAIYKHRFSNSRALGFIAFLFTLNQFLSTILEKKSLLNYISLLILIFMLFFRLIEISNEKTLLKIIYLLEEAIKSKEKELENNPIHAEVIINTQLNFNNPSLESILTDDSYLLNKKIIKVLIDRLQYSTHDEREKNINELSRININILNFWIYQFTRYKKSLLTNTITFGFAALIFGLGTLAKDIYDVSNIPFYRNFTLILLIILWSLLGFLSTNQIFQINKRRECNRILFFLESALILAKEKEQ